VTTAEIVVTVLGLLAIVWVNYWFFLSKGVKSEE
jgi:hypothetical protein